MDLRRARLVAALAGGAACTGDSHGSVVSTATATESTSSDTLGSGSDTEGGTGGGSMVVCEFPDPILEAEVRILAKVPEGPLHADDLAVIAGHWADYPPLNESSLFFGVHDLRGVECIPGLKRLSCMSCPITDLAPVAAIQGLTWLSISGAMVRELDALAGLHELTGISISGEVLEDADAILAGGDDFPKLTHVGVGGKLKDDLADPVLPALDVLVLEGNLLTRAPSLAGVPTLTTLNLSDNPIVDIDGLAGHPSLRALWIERGELTSIASLAGLPLEYLRLADNHIVDPSPIGTMPAIQEVFLSRNEVADLGGVASDTLRRLYVDDNPLQSVAGFTTTNLTELDLRRGHLTSFAGLGALAGVSILADDNQIVDLSGLAAAPKLWQLSLAGNPVDLSTLPAGLSITDLNLDDTGLDDLAPLAALHWSRLSAADNAITALPALAADLQALDLDLSGNMIGDISQLAGREFDELSRLDLSDNAIVDVSPLASVKFHSVGHVDLADNLIVDFMPLADTVGLHTLDLAGNPIGSLAPLAARELWTHVGLARLTAPVDLTEITDPALTIDSLDLSGNGLSDASALMDAELGIRALDLSRNHLTAFPALGGGLWELHLDENPLIAVAPLPPSLSIFTCAECSLTSIEGLLDAADSLSELDLSRNPLGSLAPLAGHTGGGVHFELRLDGLVGVDFAPLALLKGSREAISARGGGVVDLSPFVAAGAGETHLEDNAIVDLSPLGGKSGGHHFWLDGNPIDVEASTLDIYASCVAGLGVKFASIFCNPPVEGD